MDLPDETTSFKPEDRRFEWVDHATRTHDDRVNLDLFEGDELLRLRKLASSNSCSAETSGDMAATYFWNEVVTVLLQEQRSRGAEAPLRYPE